MRTTFLIFAILLLTTTPARAQNPDPVVDANAALDSLKVEVKQLQDSQAPMHSARKAYDEAEKAMKQNEKDIKAKKDAVSTGDKKLREDKKKLTDEANRSGGLVNHPELPGKLKELDDAWATAKGTLQTEQAALEATRTQTLKPAFEAAKTEKENKEKANDDAKKATEKAAKKFAQVNCFERNGRASRVLGSIGRAVVGSDASEDCQEVRGKIRGGLCKGGEMSDLLSQIGIDPGSKDCGPANSGGGIGGAGNGGGGIGGAGATPPR